MGNFDPPVVDFLTKQQRKEWYDKGIQFMITDVSRSEAGKFGANATFTMQRIDAKTGELDAGEHMISLTDNPVRNRVTDYITKVVDEDGSCGPMVLDKAPSGQGNDAWVFRPAPKA
jgi:hypothetical protein